MQFGIQTGQQHRTYDEILSLWQLAEHHGFSHAWLYDHLVPVGGDLDGPVFEAWTLLSSLLSRTERIRGGILVTCVMYRNPSVLAKAAATVDHASAGRVDFGLGSCWNAWEASLYGIDFPPLRERNDRLIEALQVVRTMWDASRESFEGRFYQVSGAHFQPRPRQRPHPPIWVGGTGKRMPSIAAAHADGWNVVFTTLDEYRGHLERVHRACEEIGRDPSTLRKSFGQRVSVDRDAKRAEERARMQYERNGAPFDDFVRDRFIFGSALQVADQIAAFRDTGVEQFVLWHEPPIDADAEDQIREFAETVVPLLA
ncbi:MAG TPA: TIGR03560 family F420-dependent LLM class oxidoreductase [Actinomycetota bacterium]|nr:TIGR03560 family F420-dependent LLM class oxidoreductase [Actinomycetota bacterium]